MHGHGRSGAAASALFSHRSARSKSRSRAAMNPLSEIQSACSSGDADDQSGCWRMNAQVESGPNRSIR